MFSELGIRNLYVMIVSQVYKKLQISQENTRVGVSF